MSAARSATAPSSLAGTGVPAVLGTGVATRRIHSGDVITVDGSAGVVTLPAERRFSGGPEESLRRRVRGERPRLVGGAAHEPGTGDHQ